MKSKPQSRIKKRSFPKKEKKPSSFTFMCFFTFLPLFRLIKIFLVSQPPCMGYTFAKRYIGKEYKNLYNSLPVGDAQGEARGLALGRPATCPKPAARLG